MRAAATVAVLLVTLAVTAAVVFFALLVLAGPHSSVVPDRGAPFAVAFGAVTVLALPALAARATWRRLSPPVPPQPPEAPSSAG